MHVAGGLYSCEGNDTDWTFALYYALRKSSCFSLLTVHLTVDTIFQMVLFTAFFYTAAYNVTLHKFVDNCTQYMCAM